MPQGQWQAHPSRRTQVHHLPNTIPKSKANTVWRSISGPLSVLHGLFAGTGRWRYRCAENAARLLEAFESAALALVVRPFQEVGRRLGEPDLRWSINMSWICRFWLAVNISCTRDVSCMASHEVAREGPLECSSRLFEPVSHRCRDFLTIFRVSRISRTILWKKLGSQLMLELYKLLLYQAPSVSWSQNVARLQSQTLAFLFDDRSDRYW